jgi:hypothetical protein
MWAAWMLMGGFGLKAFQICFRGMAENDERDSREESWRSIQEIQ